VPWEIEIIEMLDDLYMAQATTDRSATKPEGD
jgi:hypothetical protein